MYIYMGSADQGVKKITRISTYDKSGTKYITTNTITGELLIPFYPNFTKHITYF